MTRTVLIATAIVMLNACIGCQTTDTGRGQLVPQELKTKTSQVEPQIADAAETDLIEELVLHRRAYLQTLNRLLQYYQQTGNDVKLTWAKKEMQALTTMPQYNYIIQANLAGPDLQASTSIPEADQLYKEARSLEQDARTVPIFKDKDKLRLALHKYNQLIKKHPYSDKIDDAAYRAARIYEGFKDNSIALLYYKRTFQWDADTPYPARYRAAYLLDQKFARRQQALQLYRDSLDTEDLDEEFRQYAEKRVKQLTGGSIEQ